MDACVQTGAIPDYRTPLVIAGAEFTRITKNPLLCHHILNNLAKDDHLITGWHYALICGDATGPWIAVQATHGDPVANKKGDPLVGLKTSHVVAFPQFFEERERVRRHDAQVKRELARKELARKELARRGADAAPRGADAEPRGADAEPREADV